MFGYSNTCPGKYKCYGRRYIKCIFCIAASPTITNHWFCMFHLICMNNKCFGKTSDFINRLTFHFQCCQERSNLRLTGRAAHDNFHRCCRLFFRQILPRNHMIQIRFQHKRPLHLLFKFSIFISKKINHSAPSHTYAYVRGEMVFAVPP